MYNYYAPTNLQCHRLEYKAVMQIKVLSSS